MRDPVRVAGREAYGGGERRGSVVLLEEGAADPVQERLVHTADPSEHAQRAADPHPACLGAAEPARVRRRGDAAGVVVDTNAAHRSTLHTNTVRTNAVHRVVHRFAHDLILTRRTSADQRADQEPDPNPFADPGVTRGEKQINPPRGDGP
ncbi:hypothetical protein [Promicromonospora sukumoe]